MGQQIKYTCPKCGYIMLEKEEELCPGAIVYFCTNQNCRWRKHIDNLNYKFVSINEYEKYNKEE